MALESNTRLGNAGITGTNVVGQVLQSDGNYGVIWGTATAGGSTGLQENDDVSNLLFVHYAGFDADVSIGSPQKIAESFTHFDSSIDVESGVTLSIDSGSVFSATNKTDFDIDFFASQASATNIQRYDGFENNVSTSFAADLSLTGKQKVGYGVLPSRFSEDVPYDIEDSVTVSIDESAVMVL